MNLVARLVLFTLTIVAFGLGIPFTILGFVLEDGGGFLGVGIAALATGVAFGGILAVLQRRELAARRRRRSGRRATAPVVDVKLHPHTRVGSMLMVDLTVRVPAPRGVTEATRRLLIPPTFAIGPGDEIEVLFDPDDPHNFEPAVTAERKLR